MKNHRSLNKLPQQADILYLQPLNRACIVAKLLIQQ
jgi:hypothetical protein